MPDPFKVLIIDDSDLVAQRLVESISEWITPEHILRADSIARGLALYRQSHPAVIILDV